MIRRRRARQVVLQLLYHSELNPESIWDWRAFCQRRLHQDEDLILMAQTLFLGVRQNREELDRTIQLALTRWNLDRLGAVDRNLIRLATYEMLYQQVPHRVVINEAIELAKQFGGKNSPGFVNGALDRVFRNHSEKSLRDQAQPLNRETAAALSPEHDQIQPDTSNVNSAPLADSPKVTSGLARWNRRRLAADESPRPRDKELEN